MASIDEKQSCHDWQSSEKKGKQALGGVMLQFLLPKGPETAKLLDEEEKEWIVRRRTIGLERAMRDHPEKAKLLREFFYLS